MTLDFQPLRGIRIIDLSRYAPGPYCSLLLAALGAEVIRVESPSAGDPLRALDPEAFESESFAREKLNRPRLGAVDPERLNVMGGSIAVGHPFGATGARIVATLARQLAERGAGRGLISVCTAGGMGVTAVLER